jgi:hypothetical protein
MDNYWMNKYVETAARLRLYEEALPKIKSEAECGAAPGKPETALIYFDYVLEEITELEKKLTKNEQTAP